mmetsp:Transcript_15845/g.49792  ORF Transcript_15845/g.49792 Transcript_15845/m.49792 type:complete len:284 (+) Transcript_15845:1097-1948(+)
MGSESEDDGLTPYERERNDRIERNKRVMENLNVKSLADSMAPSKEKARAPKPKWSGGPRRASSRLEGAPKKFLGDAEANSESGEEMMHDDAEFKPQSSSSESEGMDSGGDESSGDEERRTPRGPLSRDTGSGNGMSGDDEQELQRALALSMGAEVPTGKRKPHGSPAGQKGVKGKGKGKDTGKGKGKVKGVPSPDGEEINSVFSQLAAGRNFIAAGDLLRLAASHDVSLTPEQAQLMILYAQQSRKDGDRGESSDEEEDGWGVTEFDGRLGRAKFNAVVRDVC